MGSVSLGYYRRMCVRAWAQVAALGPHVQHVMYSLNEAFSLDFEVESCSDLESLHVTEFQITGINRFGVGTDILLKSSTLLIPQKPEVKQRLKCKHFLKACDPGAREQNEEERAERSIFNLVTVMGNWSPHSTGFPTEGYEICISRLHF